MIDLSRYNPDSREFPVQVWRRLVLRHLRDSVPSVFEYAEHAAGQETLRQEIARYATRSRAVRCTPAQVVVVNGSQQALDLCARLLVEDRTPVAVENPGYHGARQLFAAHGANLRPTALDASGLQVSRLANDVRLVHVTPSHQFPTGVSMSLARMELLEWARARAAVVIEDDYDSEYRYCGAPLPALQGLARGVPVIYVGNVLERDVP
jgi:GntR family transcriptional regulator/MocR family aminotransferase